MYLKINFIIALVVGLLVSLILLFIGIDHNAQGEFYSIETGQLDIGYAVLVFFSWFVPTFLVCVIIGFLGRLIFRLMASILGSPHH